MVTGLYLYCLREPSPETCPALSWIKAPAIAGGRVFLRVFDGIEAVVSEINMDDFGEMQKKAQEDVQWIKEKALVHEVVVEEAMGLSSSEWDKTTDNSRQGNFNKPGQGGAGLLRHSKPTGYDGWTEPSGDLPARLPDSIGMQAGDRLTRRVRPTGRRQEQPPDSLPVIPVKFGVIFNTGERLSKVINEESAAIKNAFNRIRGKQEWSVKFFLKDSQQFKARVREQSEQLREKSKTLAALPAGMAYFMEEEFNRELERECSQRLDSAAKQTFEELTSYACEAALVKILDNKLTGRSERMILNSAYLVAANRLGVFQAAVEKMRKEHAPHGFLTEQSGPWPAYHFAEFAHD